MDRLGTAVSLFRSHPIIFGCSGIFLVVGLWICGLPDNDVLAVAYSFPEDCGICSLDDTGVSETIEHEGSVILPASRGGMYCCGFTFQVAMRVARDRGLLKGKSVEDVRRFQKIWYGSWPGSQRRLCAMAVEELGIGREIPLEDARPGDFVQLWTVGGTGHSVIFLGWVRDENGRAVGIRYRSTGGKGIGDGVSLFSDVWPGISNIDRNATVVGRISRPWWVRILYPFRA